MDRVAFRGHHATDAPSNLPHHLTSFVGREAELRSLKGLFSTARMITLTGTGGSGKTRLAAEVVKTSLSLWPDGVWWIELEAATDVSGAVLATLALPGQGTAQDVISSWLTKRRALLVLDNCEHLVAECAALCHWVLERCPQLNVIATSREPLGVPGEVRWPVASLGDPDALLLFEARARLVSPDFKMATGNLDPVTRICERLDRLPLAIEMAAARLDVMTEHEMLTNLNDRFRLLTSETRTAPQRQKTMEAAIDWSHRLLTDDETRLFRRLSVFQGGFTLDGVQAVCADEAEANLMGLLGALVKKSMVVADRLDDGSTRFRLLESHHAYALDRLREARELELMNKRHYEYFMASLAARTIPWTGPKAVGPAPGIADQEWKALESANLWAGITWAREHAEDMGLGLALEVADFEFTDHQRARTMMLDLLSHSADSPATGAVRAKAFNVAARLVARLGDYDTGRSLADTSVTLARKLEDPELIAYIVNGAGMVYQARRELDTAGRMYDEALSLLEGSSNRRLTIEVKNCLGLLAVDRGDHATARDILTECVAHSRSEGDEPTMARHLESLANAQLGLGDIDAAAASWTESLSIYRDLNDPFGTIWCVGGMTLVAAARGNHETALRLAAVADRMSREWSLSTGSFRLSQLDEACRLARVGLGARKSEGIWNDGQAMSTERALGYALGTEARTEAIVDAGPLSRREREVVAMVAAGMTNREIAESLFIAERTAEGHVERIRNKLGFRSRTEVATWAVERGLGSRELDKPHSTSTV